MTNTAPSFTSSAQSVSLTEWADRSTNESLNTAHIATGTMSFADPDGGDTHAVAFTPEGPGYLGTFTLTGLDDATGSVGWTFSVSDSAVNYLKAGQSLTQKYDVTVDDSHGGTAMQTVTVTLIGTDDAKKSVAGAWKGQGSGQRCRFHRQRRRSAVLSRDAARSGTCAGNLEHARHRSARNGALGPRARLPCVRRDGPWTLLFELPDSARHDGRQSGRMDADSPAVLLCNASIL